VASGETIWGSEYPCGPQGYFYAFKLSPETIDRGVVPASYLSRFPQDGPSSGFCEAAERDPGDN